LVFQEKPVEFMKKDMVVDTTLTEIKLMNELKSNPGFYYCAVKLLPEVKQTNDDNDDQDDEDEEISTNNTTNINSEDKVGKDASPSISLRQLLEFDGI